MRPSRFALLLVIWVMGAAIALSAQAASPSEQAEAAWLQRSAADRHAYRAIELFAQANPDSDLPHYRIAQAYYFLGRFAPPAKKEALFLKGVEAARKAFTLNGNSVGGHYWYSACLARSLENKSLWEKRKHVKDIKGHLMKAYRLDCRFYFGGPPRVLGMLSFKSPFGSNEEAIKLLRESLTIAPNYSLTLVNLAEVLSKEKQYAEAKQLCQKALKLKPMPGYERELADDQKLAQKLLQAIPN